MRQTENTHGNITEQIVDVQSRLKKPARLHYAARKFCTTLYGSARLFFVGSSQSETKQRDHGIVLVPMVPVVAVRAEPCTYKWLWLDKRQSVRSQSSCESAFQHLTGRINMQSTIALSLLTIFLAVPFCHCQLTAFHPFINAASANFAPAPLATWMPAVFSATQYHAQDELGQASYGYAYPGQAAANFRDAWGNQVGSWAYIDPEGKEVRVSYVADAGGFRVLSNNLPQAPMQVVSSPPMAPLSDTPEVEEAKRLHFAAVVEAKARNAAAVAAANSRHRRSPGQYYQTYSHQKADVPVVHVAPASVEPSPVAPIVQYSGVHAVSSPRAVKAVPLAVYAETHTVPAPTSAVVQLGPASSPIISKFHSQDEFGQAAFGHVTVDQSASNFRDASGNQMGHYAYINPDGQPIVVYYTAGAGGFQVVSNALPQAPTVPVFQYAAGTIPAVVQDTAEVVQARREHLALVKEARSRVRL
ncbi:hypothetical protein GHT06_021323 [Daphnia sinensis]|uniref:Cuticle protein 6 n=1 Tax=Daphnia sinensis TaxID=1820382 RepID=A0AAD5KJL5_9CRUS|nr:hypothetical protein GHT06_021323 [Daphnia sinensis]